MAGMYLGFGSANGNILRGPKARGGVQVGPPLPTPLNKFGRTNEYQQQVSGQRDDEDRAYELEQRRLNLASMQPTPPPTPNPGGAGGSSGAQGGIQIGGSIYPDISQMYAQIGGDVKLPDRPSAPQVPSPVSGFAHAKDVAGRQGNQAIEALRNSMTRRGISDSGMATMGEANILGQVARQGADAEYDAANVLNDRQWDANQMDYRGRIGHNELDVQTQMANRNPKQAILRALMAQLY